MAPFDHVSAQTVDFQSVASLEVVVHRGRHRCGQDVAERETIVREVLGELYALRPPHRDDFAHRIVE